jgi:hypothetical protein
MCLCIMVRLFICVGLCLCLCLCLCLRLCVHSCRSTRHHVIIREIHACRAPVCFFQLFSEFGFLRVCGHAQTVCRISDIVDNLFALLMHDFLGSVHWHYAQKQVVHLFWSVPHPIPDLLGPVEAQSSPDFAQLRCEYQL